MVRAGDGAATSRTERRERAGSGSGTYQRLTKTPQRTNLRSMSPCLCGTWIRVSPALVASIPEPVHEHIDDPGAVKAAVLDEDVPGLLTGDGTAGNEQVGHVRFKRLH